MISVNNLNKMTDKEINTLIVEIIEEIKKKPGNGEINIGIRGNKVRIIKPSPTYNIGEGKKN